MDIMVMAVMIIFLVLEVGAETEPEIGYLQIRVKEF